jgi:hypothetical protein
MRKLLLSTAVVIFALTGVAYADRQVTPSSEFQQGLADREAWESWFASLPQGQYKSGAEAWSGQRSLPSPMPCDMLGGDASMGCYAAKARLDQSDMRRKLASSYKLGWNSYTAPTPKTEEAKPAPQQQPTIIVQQSVAPQAPAPAPVVVQAPAPAPVVASPTRFPTYDINASCATRAGQSEVQCQLLTGVARAAAASVWTEMPISVRAECRQNADRYGDYQTLYECVRTYANSQ